MDKEYGVMSEKIKITPSCGNVFEDLGLPNAEKLLALAKVKAALERVRALRNTIKEVGVDGICQHIEDVDGDWLEKW